MTVTQTRQTVRDWISGIVQGKQAPADKLAEVEQLQWDKAAELQKLVESSDTFRLEKELSVLEEARVALLPAVAQAQKVAYQQEVAEWDGRVQAGRQRIATKLLEAQIESDAFAAECALFPRPPAGEMFYNPYNSQVYDVADGLARAGEGLGLFDRTNDAGGRPRLVPRGK